MEPTLSETVADNEVSNVQVSISEDAIISSRESLNESEEEEVAAVSGEPSFTDTSDVQNIFRFSRRETQSTAISEPSKDLEPALKGARPSATRYKVPVPPSPNDDFSGETFLCQFCLHWVSGIKRSSDWTKHVFGDLEPYMCTYSE